MPTKNRFSVKTTCTKAGVPKQKLNNVAASRFMLLIGWCNKYRNPKRYVCCKWKNNEQDWMRRKGGKKPFSSSPFKTGMSVMAKKINVDQA